MVLISLAFVVLLGYLTILSMPTPPPSGVQHTARNAEAECVRAVSDSVLDARFPFGATVSYEGDARYRLRGTVESPAPGEMVRRNYECVVQYQESGRYLADSVRVWQSH